MLVIVLGMKWLVLSVLLITSQHIHLLLPSMLNFVFKMHRTPVVILSMSLYKVAMMEEFECWIRAGELVVCLVQRSELLVLVLVFSQLLEPSSIFSKTSILSIHLAVQYFPYQISSVSLQWF